MTKVKIKWSVTYDGGCPMRSEERIVDVAGISYFEELCCHLEAAVDLFDLRYKDYFQRQCKAAEVPKK